MRPVQHRRDDKPAATSKDRRSSRRGRSRKKKDAITCLRRTVQLAIRARSAVPEDESDESLVDARAGGRQSEPGGRTAPSP
mmetsp:Transcript_14847/g.33518  ORF Transcript_14847/g.33518 Transcript_14847/m.33518 type:complete len:81 (+) Transcript_14847:443-685(+)